jgi:flavin-dependent thymidylate synthase
VKVELINYTSDALNLLLGTKNTRLAHDDDPASWSEEKKAEHLAYMRDTIKSSWEFVDYTFRISGVSRAFTHQLVRTRTGSYAQESQRTVNVADHDTVVPETIDDINRKMIWEGAAGSALEAYSELIDAGVPVQDARGLLPTAIETSIIAKFNLRTLHETAKLRLCTRTQGEYQDVFRSMRARVIEVHPWAEDFLDVYCAAHGTCAFPRFGKTSCPLYKHVMPQEELERIRGAIRGESKEMKMEAVPVARDGKTM